MSKIGSNIRKIRLTKGYSQTQFANLFQLTRASVGAYEEGRAEPKIDKAIEIAKHFSITLDTLFTKSITVNQLSNFNFSNALEQPKHKSTLKLRYVGNRHLKSAQQFIAHFEEEAEFETVIFPKGKLPADTYFNLSKSPIEGLELAHLDALICKQVIKPPKNKPLLVVTANTISIGQFIDDTSELNFTAINSNRKQTVTDIKYLFEIQQFLLSEMSHFNALNSRLNSIEDLLAQIHKSQ